MTYDQEEAIELLVADGYQRWLAVEMVCGDELSEFAKPSLPNVDRRLGT